MQSLYKNMIMTGIGGGGGNNLKILASKRFSENFQIYVPVPFQSRYVSVNIIDTSL